MTSYEMQFGKERTALKFFLLGRNYSLAIKALGFAERYHVGLRKDGKTPEFHHQIRIALSATQLPQLINEEGCLTAALLHDVQEDYAIDSRVIQGEFGSSTEKSVWALTKKFANLHKNHEDYITDISLDPVASIVKGLDRIDNLQSMLGVFSKEKIESYATEARVVFLPTLKKASNTFPEQAQAYYAISQTMKKQLQFIEAIIQLS